MGIQTKQIVTCDAPACRVAGRPISEGDIYIDAMTYGATFHSKCWEALPGPVLAKALGLDEIKWRIAGDNGLDGGKVIYTLVPSFDR
jgi:hypothetical protein